MKFSIIIPTYNRSKSLAEAINSVLIQTYTNWELIIVDDGSTDNTESVVNSFVCIDERINYFFQENGERSKARNLGINKSTGEWICFLDSDDLYHETHLQEFKSLIINEQKKPGLYISGLSIKRYNSKDEKYDLSGLNWEEFILLNTIETPRACVFRKVLIANQFNEKLHIGEDRELWIRIVKKFPVFFHCRKTIIQIPHKNRSVNLGTEMLALKTTKFILKKNKVQARKKIKNFYLSNAYFGLAKYFVKKNKSLKSILYLSISILSNIFHPQTKHKIALILSIMHLYKTDIMKEYKISSEE